MARKSESAPDFQKSKKLFESMFEQSPIGIELYDAEGSLLRANHSCLEIFGVIDEAEIRGFKLFEDPNLTPEALTSLARGEAVRYESRFDFAKVIEQRLYRTTRSGVVYLDVSITPIRSDADAEVSGFLVQVQDETSRRRAEEALRRSERDLAKQVRKRTAELTRANRELQDEIATRQAAEECLRETAGLLERVFSAVDVHLAYLDTDLNFIRVNRAYAEAAGFRQEELVGKNCFSLFPSSETEAIFHQVLATGEPFVTYSKRSGYEHPLRGVTYWDWSLQPVKDAGGSVNALVLSLIDVTARVQAEERMRQEHRFRQAIENSLLTGIVSIDLQGRHTYASPSFCRMIGLAAEELLHAAPPFPYWPPEDRETMAKTFQRVLDGSYPAEGLEARFMRSNGERFDALIIVSPLVDESGKQTGWVASVGDITNRKRDTEALRSSSRQLRRLSAKLLGIQEKERRHISQELHDSIGQTLSAVKFGLEKLAGRMMDERSEPDSLRRMLGELSEMVREATKEVRAITSDLRPTIIDDLGIIAALSWFCAEFERLHEAVTIEQCTSIEEAAVPAHLKIVIYRIVQEALNNVGKHCEAAHVVVAFDHDGTTLNLRVEDDGPGFDPQHKTAGLGLMSMRERTELSGGSFVLTSKLGEGTVIRASWRPLELSI